MIVLSIPRNMDESRPISLPWFGYLARHRCAFCSFENTPSMTFTVVNGILPPSLS